jgi:hypothetical protein
MLNLELANKIAAEDEYFPRKEEMEDIFEMERAGLVELATLAHPVAATYQLTEKGRQWLRSSTANKT